LIKKIKQSKFLKNSMIYLSADILNKAMPFLLLPILTTYLTPRDYGLISLFSIITGILTIIIGLNLNGAINISYFKLRNKILLSQYVGNAIILLIIMTIIILFLAFLYSALFSIKEIALPFLWIIIAIIVSLAQVIIRINLTLYQAEEKAKEYVSFEFIQVLINLILSLILIVGYSLSWEGRLIAIATTSIVFANISLYILFKYRKMIQLNIKQSYIKDMLSYGIPLLPHSLAGWGKTSLDRLIIVHFLGLNELGIYTIAYQIASILNIILVAFNRAWTPYLYARLNNISKETKYILVKYTYIYFILVCFLYLFLSLFIDNIFEYFIDATYSSAIILVPIIMSSFIFGGMYYMVGSYILYEKKTGVISKATVSSTLLHLILVYFSIQYYGLVGVAVSMVLSYFFNFIIVWYFSNQVFDMPWFKFNIKEDKL